MRRRMVSPDKHRKEEQSVPCDNLRRARRCGKATAGWSWM